MRCREWSWPSATVKRISVLLLRMALRFLESRVNLLQLVERP